MSDSKKKRTTFETPVQADSQVQVTRAAMVRGLIFGTIVGLGAYGYRHGWFSAPEPPTAAEEAKAVEIVAERNVDFGKSMDRMKVVAEWQRRASSLQSLNQSLSENLAKLPVILQDIAELETSDEGRKMSGESSCLEVFQRWREWTPPSEIVMKGWQAEIASYLTLCTAAIEDQSVIIGPDTPLIEKCSQLAYDVGDASDSIETAEKSLRFVRQFSADKPFQDQTIAEVLNARATARTAGLEQEKAAVREKAWEEKLRSELETEMAIAAQEQATREVEQRICLEAAQTARQKEELRLQTMQEQRIAAEEKKLRLARFDKALPEIRSLLAPMISDGTQQIGPSGWNPGARGPVSFSVLKKCRSLELDERGMYMLGSIFCDVHDKNDRPQGSFPMEMVSGKGQIRRAQELLNEYGEILVEKGMMAP